MRLSLGLAIALALGVGTVAHANSGGRPGPGCVGCHGAGDVVVDLVASPPVFSPGDEITVTVTLQAPGGEVAGLFVEADAGSMSTISGQGLAEVAAGLTHTQAAPMGAGGADFAFRWTAPAQVGAVRFGISVLVGNGNGGSSGDRAGEAVFDLVYGCDGQQFFLDIDGDDYGRDDAARTDCAGQPPVDHAIASGDCDDTRDTVHPGATELCNQRDDDCDGELDEDAIPIPLYPDGDGDGYYGQVEGMSTDVMMGCVGTPDYAGEPGDCEPNDPSKHPGAEEVCNLYDDNCDGRADERVRPICGVGWCAREAWTCDPANCDPGAPQPETCNLLDDDCDDDLDEDVVCEGTATCIAGECRDEATDGGGSEDPGAPGSSDGGTSGAVAAASTTGGGCGCGLDRSAAPWWLVLAGVRRRRARVSPT